MDKGLRDYRKKITIRLKNWRAELKNASPDERKQIVKKVEAAEAYHLIKIQDFQHERLIHLLVTFFFGFLFLFSLVILFTAQVIALQSIAFLDLALSAILFVTELFYIRYYYILENGVQGLYLLTDDFISLTSASPLDGDE